MKTFEIKEEFLIDGKPIKLISGAIHYFRLAPSQWEDSLYNLKALGANTVETYIPWNIHEPKEGIFDFDGPKDIISFVRMAEKIGLYVILRPSVYICAEWEFGGLPAWLLKYQGIRLRSTDEVFMNKVQNYFSVLLPKLVPLQTTRKGPVLMMQIENEYGSFGMEKEYLRETKCLMEKYGIEVPLFTSDGSWEEALDAGSLISDDVLVTGNFGSRSKDNSEVLQKFMKKHQKRWPVMCMEYWDGWFNRWGEQIIRRDSDDLAQDVKKMLEIGSLNLYMFHGGTNFGFYNGCSARKNKDLPQITSYDYDALLTEWGEPTDKYYAVQRVIKEVCPNIIQEKPRCKQLNALGRFEIQESVSLFSTIDFFDKKTISIYPMTMEELDSNYGYVLYEVSLKNYYHSSKLKIIDANDRIQIYADQKHLATQYQETVGDEVIIEDYSEDETIKIDVLVENIGRVNYGFKLNNPTQSKGIRGGIMHDIHFHQGYTQYPLTFEEEQLKQINFKEKSDCRQPSFYKSTFYLEDIGDTFIDCSSYGKGVVIVNGNNLGRYWNIGPTIALYCPKDFLNVGINEVIVFETEGVNIKDINFTDYQLIKN